MKINLLISSLLLTLPALQAGEAEIDHSTHDHHPASHAHHDHHDDAPIGVMAAHTHPKGEWMLSYRYMFMSMEENYDGTSSVSNGEALADPRFMVTATDMDMEMHMFGLMYAPTDRLTLMAMLSYVELSMNHLRMDSLRFRTESSGIGDSSLTALYRFWNDSQQQAHFGLELLLPTAETDKDDFIPGPGETRLPYPMQLGAGSWGISPSLTYLGQQERWSWGGQIGGTFYLDDNDEGYRLGNKGELTAWGARRLNEWSSASLRVTASTWGNIHGSDSDLLPLPVPTADPDLRGGSKIDFSLGLNFALPVDGASLGLEGGRHVWQDLDGPQLASDWWFVGGLKLEF